MSDPKNVESFLSHYGVLGMHWGRHGSGKSDSSKTFKDPRRAEPHQDHKDIAALVRNKKSTLSTQELKKVNDRLQTEKKYKELNPHALSKGKKIAIGVIAGGIVLYNQVNSPAGKAVVKTGKKAIDKLALEASKIIMSTL